jgi:hypothetical protein
MASLKETNLFVDVKFKKVAYFDSYLEANKVFYEWLEENK